MEKLFIVLGADIIGFSKSSEKIQKENKIKFDELLIEYLRDNKDIISIPTGDGFYLGYDSSKFSPSSPFLIIENLIENLENIHFRFVISSGYVEVRKEINKAKGFYGEVLTETRRLLDSFTGDCTILLSQDYYRKYISSIIENTAIIDNDIQINILNIYEFKDKHNINRTAYNVSFILNKIEYGYDINTCNLESFEEAKDFDSIYYEELLKTAFPMKQIVNLTDNPNVSKEIKYNLFKVKQSPFTQEYYAFLGNDIVKIATLNHINSSITEKLPLYICASKKFLDVKRNNFYKDDLIRKWERINKSLKQWKFYFLDEFIFDNCINDGQEELGLFKEEKNYVNPLSDFIGDTDRDKKEKSVVRVLNNWADSSQKPIYLVEGEAGIGKTTVLKKFSNFILRGSEFKKVIFIDPTLLTERIIKYERYSTSIIRSIYDLLEIYFDVDSGINRNNILRSKYTLDFILSSGNLVLIIDGLDELVGAFKDNFILSDFMNDILHVNKLLNRSKIIISTRSYFWNQEFEHKLLGEFDKNYSAVKLNGFNIDLATEYFNNIFGKDSIKMSKAIEMLHSISKKQQPEYSPFIVYLISDMIEKSDFVNVIIDDDSKYLNLTYSVDQVIYHILKREQKRQSLNLAIDEFMDLFYDIVFDKKNHMTMEEYDEYMDIILPKLKNRNNILSCSLIDVKDNIVSVSHDYLFEQFLIIYFSYGILNKIDDSRMEYYFSKAVNGNKEIQYKLMHRLENDSEFEKKFHSYFTMILKKVKREKKSKVKKIYEGIISSLLYIALSSTKFGSRNLPDDRTKIIKKILGGKIEHLYIHGEFYSLNFCNEIIYSSKFYDFTNFFNSSFDKNTKFIDCHFNFNKSDALNIIKLTDLSKDNFDSTCSFTEMIGGIFNKKYDTKKAINELIIFDLIEILKRLYKKGKFISANKRQLNIKYSSSIGNYAFIKALKENNAIIEESKRDYFSISDDFKTSVEQLLNNNYKDHKIVNVISRIYTISLNRPRG